MFQGANLISWTILSQNLSPKPSKTMEMHTSKKRTSFFIFNTAKIQKNIYRCKKRSGRDNLSPGAIRVPSKNKKTVTFPYWQYLIRTPQRFWDVPSHWRKLIAKKYPQKFTKKLKKFSAVNSLERCPKKLPAFWHTTRFFGAKKVAMLGEFAVAFLF